MAEDASVVADPSAAQSKDGAGKKPVPPTIHVAPDHPMAALIYAIPMPPSEGDLVEGGIISAKVVDALGGTEGYIELSLKEARQAAIWGEAEQAIAGGTVYTIAPEEANKGGLILPWQGIQGFLPASQLAKAHYPRVPEGDKDKILAELAKLVGIPLSARIITADANEGKLIFSERAGDEAEEKASLIDKYQVGDVVTGEEMS